MTVLAEPPGHVAVDAVDEPAASGAPATPAPPQTLVAVKPLASDVLASVALALFSIAVAAGFARVFAGWAFFDNLLVVVIVGHGCGLVARRLGVPTWVTIPFVALVLMWTIGVMFYATTYSWGIPSGDTWTLFGAELDLVREQFHVAVAPVLDGGGWPVLAAIGMAFAVCLADAFAFGALARAEALVPGGVLFVFIAALGADRLRVELSVVLVAAGVLATVVLRAHHAPGGIRTGGNMARRVVWQAFATAAVVGLLAGYVGQRLPGASAEPLFDTRGSGDGSGTSLNPFVDIRSRLTNQTGLELIVVDSPVESYWRATTLPDFDGDTWAPADREIAPSDVDPAARPDAQVIRQQVHIVALGGTMIPAAPDLIAADGTPTFDFDFGTSTLSADDDLQRGDEFELVSAPPRFEPATLAAATSDDPGDPIYLDLPDDFPEVARQTAAEVTAGATNSYETARALQDWFKSNFRYSLEVQPGHGNSAIEGFLRDRVGYCEQFAGTYAAMMRSLDIPARVAVGFTHGQAIGGGSYSVAGRNAHAWPEVWFDGIGWVLFEPTPGRGAPGTASYTGWEPDQAEVNEAPPPSADNSQAGGSATDPAAAPTTTAASPGAGGPSIDEGPEPPEVSDAASPTDGGGPSAAWLILLVIALALPAGVRWVRRRAVGQTNDEKLRRLWERSLSALRDVDVPITASDTPTEIADQAAAAFPVASRPMKSLAEVLTEATYRPEGSAGFELAGAYGSSPLRDSAHWTRQIERAVTDSISRWARVRRYFTRWR